MTRLFGLSFLALAACGSADVLVPAPEVTAVERVQSFYKSIEVLEVSLPDYATEEQVYVEQDGTLSTAGTLWADQPARAVTLALSRNLTEITGSRVAPEPWPFESFPEARVDVRIERLLADDDGNLVLSGQVFVADLTGRLHDHARLFRVSYSMGKNPSPTAAAAARSAVVAELALIIAQEGLR